MKRIYEIPVPPPLSQLFVNHKALGRKKSERYKTWIRAAQNEMLAQQCRPFESPCILTVCLPEGMRGDLSNRIKAPEDLMVKCGVLPDDNTKFVREVRARLVPRSQPCTVILEAA